MTQINKIAIGVAVFMLIIAGAIVYTVNQIDQSYDNGYVAGQASVKITTITNTVVIHDTVRVKGKKPVTHPVVAKDTSAMNDLVKKLQSDKDSLARFIVDRMSPKSFFIADTLAHAIINYDPIKDEYDGYIVHATEINQSTSTKEIPCPQVETEAWYEDGSMYIAGGATGVLVIASGGTALLGLGVSVGVGALIAVF